MARLEDLLAQCLDDMEEGSSVEECLARYPQWRDELEPLLLTAHRIRSAPEVAPSAAFRQVARTRMLNLIQAGAPAERRRQAVVKGGLLRRAWPLRRAWSMARGLSVPVLASFLLVISMVIGGGVVYASGDSLPGDFLYPLKLTTEQVRLVLSPSETGDAQLHLSFAGERVREAAKLAERGEGEHLEASMSRYVGEMEAASEIFQKQAERGGDITPLALLLQENLAHHQMALARLRERVPKEARPVIQRAVVASTGAQKRVVVTMADIEPGATPVPETTEAPTVTLTAVTPTAPSGKPQPHITATATSTVTHRTPTPTSTVPHHTRTTTPAKRYHTPTETPKPSKTPKPTKTPQPTKTPRPTKTPALTKTSKPTKTPAPTKTPQPTKTPKPTKTPAPTKTPEPTKTPRPTKTPALTKTPKPTKTPAPTKTPQPTKTPRPTKTPALTKTPKPTKTPAPTKTPQPTKTPKPTKTRKPTGSMS